MPSIRPSLEVPLPLSLIDQRPEEEIACGVILAPLTSLKAVYAHAWGKLSSLRGSRLPSSLPLDLIMWAGLRLRG